MMKEKRATDLNFRISEILRSKVHKMIKGRQTSYAFVLDCDIEMFKRWIEYQFDENMTWNNLGSYWQIDHILPINQFDFSKERDKMICFNWTNLQPLPASENRSKTDKIILHYYYNSIVSIHRFIQRYKENTQGYQSIRESLCWLREKLRYGNNATDNNE